MTLMERIWHFYHEHPYSDVNACVEALGIQRDSASSLCAQMVRKGLLYPQKIVKEVRSDLRVSTREIIHLRTTSASFKLPRKQRTKRQEQIVNRVSLAKIQLPAVKVTAPKQLDVDQLTVGQARGLYQQLKEVFG